MSISYQDAMQQLQGMFPDFDRETLKTVLVANGISKKFWINSSVEGHFEKTIEDCLKLANENEEENLGNPDNLFSNAGGSRNNRTTQNKPQNKQYDAADNLFGDEDQQPVENAFENLGMFQNNNRRNNQSEDNEDFGDNGNISWFFHEKLEYKSQLAAKKMQEQEGNFPTAPR